MLIWSARNVECTRMFEEIWSWDTVKHDKNGWYWNTKAFDEGT